MEVEALTFKNTRKKNKTINEVKNNPMKEEKNAILSNLGKVIPRTLKLPIIARA